MLKEVTLLFLARDVTTETGVHHHAIFLCFLGLVMNILDRQKGNFIHAPINPAGLARFDKENKKVDEARPD